MNHEIYTIFKDNKNFEELNYYDFEIIDKLFFSYDQLFAISVFETQEQLINEWKQAARELAFNVQSKLIDEWDGLRWDIYLILVTNESVSLENKKKIENNRSYFKKVIISKGDSSKGEFREFDSNFIVENNKGFQIFNEDDFLLELNGCLSEDAKNKLSKTNFDETIFN